MDKTPTPTYTSLEDIRARREELARELRAQRGRVELLWGDLFHRPATPAPRTRAGWIARIVSNSAGLIDAALLGWKIYHKFFARPAEGRRRGRR